MLGAIRHSKYLGAKKYMDKEENTREYDPENYGLTLVDKLEGFISSIPALVAFGILCVVVAAIIKWAFTTVF